MSQPQVYHEHIYTCNSCTATVRFIRSNYQPIKAYVCIICGCIDTDLELIETEYSLKAKERATECIK